MSRTDFDFEIPRRNYRQMEESWREERKLDRRKRVGTQRTVKKSRPQRSSEGLHDDIVEFPRKNTPTAEHHGECERVIEITRKLCYTVFEENVTVAPFGSFANGVATKDSDVDLVITGLLTPDTPAGFFGQRRALATNSLHRFRSHSMSVKDLEAKEILLIGPARCPLLKETTISGVLLDVSINDESCCEAAHYALEKVRQLPPVRPISLLLKSFLRQYGLREVKDGGLGGYALPNMVIAHVSELVKAGIPIRDLGNVVMSFLYHYGTAFDPSTGRRQGWGLYGCCSLLPAGRVQ